MNTAIATLAPAVTQADAARVLTLILEIEDLPAAEWRVNVEATIEGRLDVAMGEDGRVAVHAYAEALGLTVEPERFVRNVPRSFMAINASGEYEDVPVRVWAAVYVDDATEAAA